MKSEKYQFRAKALYSEQQAQRVDAEAGVIYGVVLAQEGINKNDTYFSERFLNELAAYGNERGWIKSRFGHPNMCSTSLGSFIGKYKNFRVEDGKLYGDLYLDEIAKSVQVEGRGISMWDYIVKMAQSNSEVFGNSIVIIADFQEETYEADGEEKTASGHSLREWIGSDLVDDPAATDSLFHGVNDFGLLVTDFLDENPQVFEVLDKNPLMLFDFIERYEAYNNRKHNKENYMGILERLKRAFSKAFDIDLTLADGDIITVVTEADEPQVGDKVKRKTDGGADAEKPLEDGEYLLKDETTLVVKGGAIEEIKPKEEKAPEEEPKSEDEDKEQKEFQTEVMKAFDILAERVVKMEKEFARLQSVKSKFEAEEPRGVSAEPEKKEEKMSYEAFKEAYHKLKK